METYFVNIAEHIGSHIMYTVPYQQPITKQCRYKRYGLLSYSVMNMKPYQVLKVLQTVSR